MFFLLAPLLQIKRPSSINLADIIPTPDLWDFINVLWIWLKRPNNSAFTSDLPSAALGLFKDNIQYPVIPFKCYEPHSTAVVSSYNVFTQRWRPCRDFSKKIRKRSRSLDDRSIRAQWLSRSLNGPWKFFQIYLDSWEIETTFDHWIVTQWFSWWFKGSLAATKTQYLHLLLGSMTYMMVVD